jgi:hypothetical protein
VMRFCKTGPQRFQGKGSTPPRGTLLSIKFCCPLLVLCSPPRVLSFAVLRSGSFETWPQATV